MLLNIITNHYEVIARRNDALPPIVPLGFALDAPAPRPWARNQLAIALRTKEERTFGPFTSTIFENTTKPGEHHPANQSEPPEPVEPLLRDSGQGSI
jgi:hypothetical protein